MNRITLALLCFIGVSFIHSPVFAQNEEEATEVSRWFRCGNRRDMLPDLYRFQ